jgi:hypothetical protein
MGADHLSGFYCLRGLTGGRHPKYVPLAFEPGVLKSFKRPRSLARKALFREAILCGLSPPVSARFQAAHTDTF